MNVQNNNIMEAGIDYMCEIGQNLHIKSLQLSGNKFGVEVIVIVVSRFLSF